MSETNIEIGEIKHEITRTQYGNDAAMSDIIDAVYMGEGKDLNGDDLKLTYVHGKSFYDSLGADATRAAFNEIQANFTQIKMSGEQESLDKIKATFGEEFYNTLEQTFNEYLE